MRVKVGIDLGWRKGEVEIDFKGLTASCTQVKVPVYGLMILFRVETDLACSIAVHITKVERWASECLTTNSAA